MQRALPARGKVVAACIRDVRLGSVHVAAALHVQRPFNLSRIQ
jgi:hypothetical protein